jgi:uncharacterized protein YbjT (DUF2867 family)
MSSKKVVVFTATGDQGRSVALTLKAAGWDVTGVTRKPSSASAKCGHHQSDFNGIRC